MNNFEKGKNLREPLTPIRNCGSYGEIHANNTSIGGYFDKGIVHHNAVDFFVDFVAH